ncbi:hypothetical protein [Agromyces sp. LHK192]|uniref:hypothetical protein n=1 Tax=Agromyces sp. LHK192 TaxID=2498704 RepID=UPI000FD9450F|nr:hypothetical protein [Agromyces sp. LHK192]
MASALRCSSVVAVVLSVAVLSGCVQPGSGFAALERDRTAGDEVPTDLPDHAFGEADLSSSRLVGSHNDSDLYLLRSNDRRSVCLLAYPNDTEWVVSCGQGGSGFGLGGPAGDFIVRPDHTPAPDGYVAVASNVYTRG